MEEKKSHKADLEHLRPWMFLAGLAITLVSFFIILEIQVAVNEAESWDEELPMDLDLDLNDTRDMISAAQKVVVEEKEAEQLNKVDETTEIAPELDQQQQEEEAEEEEEKEDEEPINLNEDDPEIQRIVDELPQFPGGMVEYMKWLTETLKYPQTALKMKIQGKVVAQFIVEKDGSISNIELTQRVNSYLDNEALRVLKLMPKWTPGKDHGVVCRTKIAIPIVFEI